MTREGGFWAWFQANLDRLSEIRTGGEPVVRELRRQLDAVDPRLMWETGTLDDGTHDFVLSADGDRAVAPTVHRLADAAPAIPGWRITRFRPIREPESLAREGYALQASELHFGLTADPSNGSPYPIALYVPGLTEANYSKLGSVALVLLDGWLGEEVVMMRLGEVRLVPDGPGRSPHAAPMVEMARLLDLT